MGDYADRISKLPPKRLALLVHQLQEKLDGLQRQRREPIAVVGNSSFNPGTSRATYATKVLLFGPGHNVYEY